jgi:hypothetical protein
MQLSIIFLPYHSEVLVKLDDYEKIFSLSKELNIYNIIISDSNSISGDEPMLVRLIL